MKPKKKMVTKSYFYYFEFHKSSLNTYKSGNVAAATAKV